MRSRVILVDDHPAVAEQQDSAIVLSHRFEIN
jgi:hypothetical protein